MKRNNPYLLLALALGAGLTGCGGDSVPPASIRVSDDGIEAPTGNSATAPSTVTTASLPTVTGDDSGQRSETAGTGVPDNETADPAPAGLSCSALEEQLRNSVLDYIDMEYAAYQYAYSSKAAGLMKPAIGAPESGAGNTTNVRTDGVDEYDRTKLAGDRLYMMVEDTLHVLHVGDDGALEHLAGHLQTSDYVYGLLANGDHVLVISYDYREHVVIPGIPMKQRRFSMMKLTLLDLSQPRAPVTLAEQYIEGDLVAATAHGGVARLVIRSDVHPLAGALYDYHELHESWDASHAALVADVSALTIDDLLPRRFVRSADGTLTQVAIAEADCRAYVDLTDNRINATFPLVLASIDMTDKPSVTARHVDASWPTVYVTPRDTYLSVHEQVSASGDAIQRIDMQHVHQFTTRGSDAAQWLASGKVLGRLPTLQQFAMDAQDGYLRVATTTGLHEAEWSGDVSAISSRLTTLWREGDRLVEAGLLDGLAPGEQLYAARFSGDRAYLATFEEIGGIDPLITIDLADNRNPQALGELTFPGFVGYLHEIDDNRLLGIGADGPDLMGTHVSLFDVSDMQQPARTGHLVFDNSTSGASVTPVLWDHHAFQYGSELALLPMSRYLSEVSAALAVLDTTNGGLAWKGDIVHSYDVHRPNGGVLKIQAPIERSFIRDGRIISVSYHAVTVHDPSDLDSPLASYTFD